MKKFAVEAHRMFSNTYGETAISERTSREWFQRFKNGDFDIEGKHGGEREKVFKNARRIGRIIGSDSMSHFKMPESHGNNSETRKLGIV